ncbi:MAG TPA: hypothetical protein GXX25_03385 [Desulfotomaculum sp.]|nr:hypothetical protein [Desulfotomaculum sp.]
MTIAEIFMGWPAIISSLFFAAAGIIRRRPAYLVLAAVLLLGITLYLAGTPRFRFTGILLPISFPAAAVVVHRRKIWLAIILVSPTFIFFGWLAAIVLYQ